MDVATWLDRGSQAIVAITAAAASLNLIICLQPHVAPDADVAPERAQEPSADHQVTGEAGDERWVIGQRDKRDVGAELRHDLGIRDDQQRQRDRGRDQSGHHALDHERSAHEPFGGPYQLHDFDLLAAAIDGSAGRGPYAEPGEPYPGRRHTRAGPTQPRT